MLEVIQSLALLAEPEICGSEKVESIRFAVSLICGPHQWKRLIVIFDRFPLVIETLINLPDHTQRPRFSLTVVRGSCYR